MPIRCDVRREMVVSHSVLPRELGEAVRKFMTLICGSAIAWSLACYAQVPTQMLKRVGLLAIRPCPLPPDDLIIRRLGELGWVEGQTMVFDCVSAAGRAEQVPELARELVSRRPDVLMAAPPPFVGALKQATTTIPIIMLGTWEPVRAGLIAGLAQPGANVTGIAWIGLIPKQMELLKEIVPNLRRVAYLRGEATYTSAETLKIEDEILQSTSRLGFTWQIFEAAVASDYDEIFARLAAEHFDAAYLPGSPLSIRSGTHIGQLALRHRIPTVSGILSWVKDSGHLLAYGQDASWNQVRALGYVDKVLRGAKPSDLPVEQPTNLDLVINVKTAKVLGLTVPSSLLSRAVEVIE